MSNEIEEKVEIKVKEEQDGSVTVDLPESIPSPDVEEEGSDDVQEAKGGEVSSTDEDDADQVGDTEAIRAARRARRRAKKEYIKQTNVEKDQRLAMLDRQNRDLMERLSVVERKSQTADLARIDKAIEDKEMRVQYAAMKISEATSAADGEALIKAQEMWYETRREVEALKNIKNRAVRSAQEPAPIDNSVKVQAQSWMERNNWYDPNSDDEEVAITKMVDERLVKEGWNPSTSEYWDELDRRLQKRLPHRYTEDSDERNSRPVVSRKPRSVVTGSGRESVASSGGKNTFVLAPEQVRAMKDAGLWENPESRNRMIKRYAEQARNNRS
jgi:hypothetical protein